MSGLAIDDLLARGGDGSDLRAAWGVGPDTQVVAYDADTGAYAARLWWMLRWVGHERVAVLDGGYKAWTAAGLPISTEIPHRSPSQIVKQQVRNSGALTCLNPAVAEVFDRP